ncbi:MAG: proton-conducting transporter membrane subunit, partial [Limisphaera sp.]
MRPFPWLTVLTLIPLCAGLGVMRWGVARARLARCVAIGAWAMTLVLVLGLGAAVDLQSGALQAVERYPWVPALGIEYYVGVDGLSWVMLLLTVLVTGMALVATEGIRERPHLFYGLVLCLMAGLFGTFTALNFVHWFLFWELSLIPAFFLVRLWGGPQRQGAALQFFLFTLAGSVAMLLGFLALFLASGQMNFPELSQWAREGRLWSALEERWGGGNATGGVWATLVFLGVLAGLAVKV